MARTILVADDSPTIQKKASGILTGEGLDVVTVSNGVAAVKKLKAISPLVVLADVSMPGKDGYEVCEFVKGSAEHRHVPVVLIFSDMDTYEEARGASAQADGRIRKPFDGAELIAIVSKFVAQAEAAAPKPAGAKAAPARKPAPTQPKVVKPAVPSLTALKRDLHARLIEAIADFATTCELPADLTRADVLDDISKVCAYIPTSGWDARLTQHSLGGRNPNKDIPITSGAKVRAVRKAAA